MENPAILLRRLNPYCARAMEGAASLCQPLLSHRAAGQKPHTLMMGRDEVEGIAMEFNHG